MPVTVARSARPRSARAGFSLVELMITLVLLAIVVAVVATVLISSQISKAETEGRIEAQQNGRAISDIISADLRTAGFGTDVNTVPNQPPFAYVDSVEIMINVNQTPFPDTAVGGPVSPKALNPSAAPLPHKLTGSYLPGSMYTSGAETIVYTLDLNNDGLVDASDQAQPIASEAQRTSNPNDYVLGRVVYGYDGATNGGSIEKVGLVRAPGAGIPPMFSVYLNGSPTPWNWNNGPVPAARLKDITSVRLKVTTEGRRARRDGTYPRATLTTEINSIRNEPNTATTKLYHVTGYVFKDTNGNNTFQSGTDPGVPGTIVRLGNVAVAQTSVTGYYDVAGPPQQYLLKQYPPPSFQPSAPDSIQIDFLANPNDQTHDFADTARWGAWVNDTCYVDRNGNLQYDPGDLRVAGATVSGGGQSRMTGVDGAAALFVAPGTQTISVSPPDSFQVVSTNPVTLSIVNGVNVGLQTRMLPTGTGTVTGTVFLDLNKNGTRDVGESGIPNTWVGVTADGGVTVLGFGTTDGNGNYSIVVPCNMPSGTRPYAVTVIPPNGYYPTGTTAISPVWLSTGQTVSGQNFGMVNYTSFTLFADRVLALGTANLLEKDWPSNANQYATKGSFDEDLILCSEYVANPNISVWWNQMGDKAQVFDSTFTYQVNAQSSALCITTGSIDTSAVFPNVVEREDAVTGLAYKPSGNIAVWMTQNTSGNEGYFNSTPILYSSADNGDVQQVRLMDVAGGAALDLVVGTKSPTAYTGTLEVWRGNGNGTFTRDEIYPPAGNLAGNRLGEVKALVRRDVTGDGLTDLLVGTRDGDGVGRLHVLQFVSKANGNRFREINAYDVVGEVTSMVGTDVDGDGHVDLVLGTRVTSSTGTVQFWRGNDNGSFSLAATYAAPGPVLSVAAADLGGTARQDIIFGYRLNESSFAGGVRILYTDLGTLPPSAVDPAGGTSSYMTTSIAAWNFNYRLNPTTAGPYLTDFAVAQKPTATTGRLFVFVR